MSPLDTVIAGFTLACAVFLALAWLIGVQDMLSLISCYRRHPEDYADRAGLARWMGWTLAAGGASFGLCALVLAAGVVPVEMVGSWAAMTGVAIAVALGGIAKYRHRGPPGNCGRPPRPDRR
jgi:hypothetical protein